MARPRRAGCTTRRNQAPWLVPGEVLQPELDSVTESDFRKAVMAGITPGTGGTNYFLTMAGPGGPTEFSLAKASDLDG